MMIKQSFPRTTLSFFNFVKDIYNIRDQSKCKLQKDIQSWYMKLNTFVTMRLKIHFFSHKTTLKEINRTKQLTNS